MKNGLSAFYNIFMLALTTVGVISVLYFATTAVPSLSDLEWLGIGGCILVIYVIGIIMSFAGLYAIDKMPERYRKKA